MYKRYLLAILIAIVILVVNQLFIQYFLFEKKYDAKTINLAGKQRMLSQKINLEFYKVLKDNQTANQLPSLIGEWKNTHYNLLNNFGESKLSPITDLKALELMSKLSLRISFVEEQMDHLSAKQDIDLPLLNDNQTEYLVEMNQVVGILEEVASDKLGFIVTIELLLMMFSLLIIILEVVFIFKPSHQKLVQSLAATQKSKKELEQSLIELKRKKEDLEQFAYVASHDLQEPLRTVISFSQLLNKKYKKEFEKNGKDEIELIIDATRRMKSLITGLLAYTRVGRKKAIKSIDCNDLIDNLKNDLDTALTEKKAILNVGELPELMVYEIELRQLFQNLITNALKFQRKEAQPKIMITGKNLEDRFQFSIQDNGIGIEEAYQEQIFMIFKRLHTIDKYEGTGIGLAQCKKIVELHNGEIWVDSKKDQGSTFHFTIAHSIA